MNSKQTTGSLYFWAAHFAGPRWGPFASWCCAWLEAIGLISGIGAQVLQLPLCMFSLSTNTIFSTKNNDNNEWWTCVLCFYWAFSGSQALQFIILLATGNNKGGGYFASKGVFLGMYVGLTIIWAVLNTFALQVVAFLSIISIWWQVCMHFNLFVSWNSLFYFIRYTAYGSENSLLSMQFSSSDAKYADPWWPGCDYNASTGGAADTISLLRVHSFWNRTWINRNI